MSTSSMQEARLISRRDWRTKCDPLFDDRVFIRNLSVSLRGAKDAWGHYKPQPVQLSVTLLLKERYQSVAENDEIDGRTVHYGHLSKSILNQLEGYTKSLKAVMGIVRSCCYEQLSNTVGAVEVEIFMPKASMFGSGVRVYQYQCEEMDQVRSLEIEGICLPALIGVNDYERNMKQPVVIHIRIDLFSANDWEDSNELEPIILKVQFQLLSWVLYLIY